MKNFGFILIVFFSSLLSANANVIAPSSTEAMLNLQKELVELVGDLNIDNFDLDENQRFTVEFIVNDSGEIVVLKTSSKVFDKAIKSRMNYHTVVADVDKNHKYILPITVKK